VTVGGGPIDPSISRYPASTTSSKVTWLGSFDWRPIPQLMLYTSVSRGYRAGGFSIQAASSVPATAEALAANFTPFLPEVVTNYEFGFKSDLLHRQLRVNGAIYYQDYTNIQQQIRDIINGASVSLIRNAASAHPYGGELEIIAQPSDRFNVDIGLSYLHASYDKYFARDSAGNLLDLSNLVFPAPKFTWNVGTHYTVPLSTGDLRFDLNYAFTSKVDFRPGTPTESSVTQPAYGLLDGRISWNIEDLGLNIAVFGKNLTNEHYLNAATNLQGVGWNIGFPGDPRTFGIQVRKTF
jgi:iron complex outermembrane receptor protein